MRIRSWLLLAGLLVVFAFGVYLAGPRMPVEPPITFNTASIGGDPVAYLKAREARYNDIIPGEEKQIIWADAQTKAKTPYAVVYIHGFSASAGEIRPVPDMIARQLGANLYFTRLQGHGRTAHDAMAEATLAGWLDDYAEAVAIGKAIGNKVIVIATSTGGSLAAYGLSRPELSSDVAAAILVSPNFGVKAAGSFLLTGPWARQLVHLVLGPTTGFTPQNDAHAQLWTSHYPTDALLPMAQSVRLALSAPVEQAKTPALFVYSSSDTVVRAEETVRVAARWGALHDSIDVGNIGTGGNHVIAGDALSPQMTTPLADRMIEWLEKTLGPSA